MTFNHDELHDAVIESSSQGNHARAITGGRTNKPQEE
jgi:hypothetical protein